MSNPTQVPGGLFTSPVGDSFTSPVGEGFTSPGAGGATHATKLGATGIGTTGLRATGLSSPTIVPEGTDSGSTALFIPKGAIAGIARAAVGDEMRLPRLEKSRSNRSCHLCRKAQVQVPVQSHPDSMVSGHGFTPPTLYSPVNSMAPLGPNANQNGPWNEFISPNASYGPSAPWTPTSQPAPLNPTASYSTATSSTSTKYSEPNYYGGGKYAVSWEATAPDQEPSKPPPSSSLQPHPHAEVDAGPVQHPSTLPPSYNAQWRQ
ncbi:hypothetical protein DFH09DRAFT_1074245 [Mycena vulgaris]|nr:hypothetical protein DFH09DRAFT_1074245 [Mycena vulgaris]